MRLIETKPVGDANFYKFPVDFIGGDFILGGKTNFTAWNHYARYIKYTRE